MVASNEGTADFYPGTRDVVGELRVNGGAVDLGAFENHEILLANGFE
jgi:hypothetical protein